jgi:NADH:ubiquinone oxidoreductase subunit E/CheY-like chemotaxis protein
MQQVQEIETAETSVWPHILVMEDEPSVAKGLEVVLSEEGYAVDLAMNGVTALDSFNQKAFDLLIADLRLPDIDGMDVIRQVKHRRPDTGVIVITGYSTIPSAVEAMKLGAADYLSKPFTEDEVVSAVKDALGTKGAKQAHPAEVAREPLPEDLQKSNTAMMAVRRQFSGQRQELIAILQFVQNQIGFIPETALEQIAGFTHTPTAAVYGVVTFYEQFRLEPVGRHIIKVCRGTACHVKGAERILSEMSSRYGLVPGQTSADRMFTLDTVACFGSCAIAPVVVMDDKVRGRMDPRQVRKAMDAVQKPSPGDQEP